MRSSKSRSRSKSNRQRSIGNIINRVFDSSGPESKVRGTPQQIIDKYLQLARDAQLGNDRVAEQNFLQHAEHYTRMLGEATAEMARENEARQQQGGQPGNQNNGHNQNNGNGNGNGNGQYGQGTEDGGNQQPQPQRNRNDDRGNQRNERNFDRNAERNNPDRNAERNNERQNDNRNRDSGPVDVIDTADEDGPGLVETPEARRDPQPDLPLPEAALPNLRQPEAEPKPKPRAPRPRKPKAPVASDVPNGE
jgi:hypothetical protein